MKDYQTYLFDMDGTIVNTFDMWIAIMQSTLKQYGIELTDKQVVRKVFGNSRGALIELGVPEADMPAVFAQWDRKAQETVPHIEIYEGAEAMLRRLKQRDKKLALVTATARPTVEILLESHGMADIFEVLVCGNEITHHKPHPESVLLALERLGQPGDAAIMLGDSEKDIRAAHAAGIDSALFHPRAHAVYHVTDDLMADKPTYHIEDWDELQ